MLVYVVQKPCKRERKKYWTSYEPSYCLLFFACCSCECCSVWPGSWVIHADFGPSLEALHHSKTFSKPACCDGLTSAYDCVHSGRISLMLMEPKVVLIISFKASAPRSGNNLYVRDYVGENIFLFGLLVYSYILACWVFGFSNLLWEALSPRLTDGLSP